MSKTESLRMILCSLLFGLGTVFLVSSPAFAQATSTASQAQYITGPINVCQGAQVVSTTAGTKDKQSPIFQIAGGRSRITIVNNSKPQKLGRSNVSASLNTVNGNPVEKISKEGKGTASTFVNTGSGNFYIQTDATNANYAVIVQVCANMQVNNPPNSTNLPTTPSDPPATQPTESTKAPGNVSNPDGVVPNTIPKGGTLADTGGMSPGFVALALVLLGGGLFVYTSVRRGR